MKVYLDELNHEKKFTKFNFNQLKSIVRNFNNNMDLMNEFITSHFQDFINEDVDDIYQSWSNQFCK